MTDLVITQPSNQTVFSLYQATQTGELNNLAVDKVPGLSKKLLRFYSDVSTESKSQIISILTYLFNLLPQGFSLNLGYNNIGAEGAQAIAAALENATLRPGFSLNLRFNKIDAEGVQAIANILRLNPALQITGEGLEEINEANQKILDFAKIDYLAGDKAKQEIVEKRNAIIEKIKETLKTSPESIFNLLKWLTQESTTAMLTSWQSYIQLAQMIHDVMFNKRELFSKSHDDILSLIKDTWLEDTVVEALSLSFESEVREQSRVMHDSDATLLARDILINDKKTLESYTDYKPDDKKKLQADVVYTKQSEIFDILQFIVFSANQDVKDKKPAQAIAHSELMQLMNILLPRAVNQNLLKSPTKAFLDSTQTISRLKCLYQLLYSYAVSDEVKQVMSRRPSSDIIKQYGIFSKLVTPIAVAARQGRSKDKSCSPR